MEKNIKQPNSQHEGGAALIVVVLLALLVLAGLVLVTSNLALNSRRSTTEQKAIIPAQLAAESGVAYAKAKLDAANKLFGNMGIPSGTTDVNMRAMIASLCPSAPTLPLGGTDTTITIEGNVTQNGQLICDLSNTSLTTNQAAILATLMSGSTGQVIRSTSGTAPVNDPSTSVYTNLGLQTDSNSRKQFFADLFSPSTVVKVGDTNVKSGLQPLKIIQVQDTGTSSPYRRYYRFYFKAAGLDSTASKDGSTRRISVAGNDTIHVLNIDYTVGTVAVTTTPPPIVTPPIPGTPPSFAGYGLFVNDFGGSGGSYGEMSHFSGPFHSNTWMNLTSDGKVSLDIDGKISSAGCEKLGTDSKGQETCLNASGQVYASGHGDKVVMDGTPKTTADYANYSPSTSLSGYRNYGNPAIQVKDYGVNTPAPNFAANLVPLPINNQRQRSMANSGGILLNNPRIVQLSVNGNYQNISITTADKTKVELRFDSSSKMQIKSGSTWVDAVQDTPSPGGWRAVTSGESGGTFNGMLFADGSVGSLTGPTRTNISDTTATGGPAIAKFASLTIAAEKSVWVTGDLKYETRCSTMDACTAKDSSGNFVTKNILGIYAANGDIKLPYNSTSLNQNTDPTNRLSAPKNLQIDGFLMATKKDSNADGIGTVQPYNTATGKNTYTSSGNRGTFVVHGGTVKTEETVVGGPGLGWTENYFFDARGNSYSPPGFPTTTEGLAGTSGSTTQPPPTTTYVMGTDIDGWSGGISKFNPDGTEVTSTTNFSLDKEIFQKKAN